MAKEKRYNIIEEEPPLMLNEPEPPSIQTFSSQEEAELYRLKRNLARSDMEKFEMLCRMMRIGKMLSPDNIFK